MKLSAMLRNSLLVALVVILGGFAGWYMFVQKQIKTTGIADTARGFGTTAGFGAPTGSSNENLPGTTFTTSTTSIQDRAAGKPAPRLWHVTGAPVAGALFAGTTTKLFFAERATGNILSADPTVQGIERLTNTLFPKIYEALFTGNGGVLLRTVADDGTITTFAGMIGTSSPGTPAALKGVYLPQNIVSLSAKAATSSIFALIEDPRGGTIGVTTDWKGQKQTQVLVSALSNWRTFYLDDGSIYLTQKAADNVPGYAFRLSGKSLTPLMGGVAGLVILPRSKSSALLYSTSHGGGVTLFAKASASSSPVKLPIKTLAEKCVWVPGASLVAYCAVPEATLPGDFEGQWYRGLIHTSDTWWRVDVTSGTAQEIFSPENGSFDVQNPVMDSSGQYIAFTDASNQSLWLLRIVQ